MNEHVEGPKGPQGPKGPSLTDEQVAKLMGEVYSETSTIFERNQRREKLRESIIGWCFLIFAAAMILGALGHRLGLW